MNDDQQALTYDYFAQFLSLTFTGDKMKAGFMCIRMYIHQHAKAYVAVAMAQGHGFVDRRYSELYQGHVEVARLRLRLHALVPRPVGVLPRLQDDQASDLL